MTTGEFTKQVEELGYKVKRYATFTGDNLYISNGKRITRKQTCRYFLRRIIMLILYIF